MNRDVRWKVLFGYQEEVVAQKSAWRQNDGTKDSFKEQGSD